MTIVTINPIKCAQLQRTGFVVKSALYLRHESLETRGYRRRHPTWLTSNRDSGPAYASSADGSFFTTSRLFPI
jgi:hypothetical protein